MIWIRVADAQKTSRESSCTRVKSECHANICDMGEDCKQAMAREGKKMKNEKIKMDWVNIFFYILFNTAPAMTGRVWSCDKRSFSARCCEWWRVRATLIICWEFSVPCHICAALALQTTRGILLTFLSLNSTRLKEWLGTNKIFLVHFSPPHQTRFTRRRRRERETVSRRLNIKSRSDCFEFQQMNKEFV